MSEKTDVLVTLFYMTGCRYCEDFKEDKSSRRKFPDGYVWEWDRFTDLVKSDSRLAKFTVNTIAVESRELNDDGLANIKNKTGIKVVPTINGQEFRGFPTVKIEINGNEFNYSDERKAENIISFILEKAEKSAKTQGGGGKTDYRKKYKKWKSNYAVLLKKYRNLKNGK